MPQIPIVGGLLGRLPAAVFVIAGLILTPWLLEALNVQPDAINVWLGDKVLWDIQAAIALMPLLAALAGLVGLAFLVAHHHVAAIAAVGVMVALVVIDVAWHLTGLGAWATSHLGVA